MTTTPLSTRLLYWLLPPLALMLAVLGGRCLYTHAQEQKRLEQQQALQQADDQRQQQQALQAGQAQTQREFALEVRGLGIALDRFRQTRIWEELDKAKSPYHSIMPQDPKAYPWSELERSQNADTRRGNAFEYALREWVQRWPIPVILIAPPRHPKSKAQLLAGDLSSIDQSAGLGITLYTTLEAEHTDRADRTIAKLFDWFDRNPDMPAAVVLSMDSMHNRDYYRNWDTPRLVKDGYEVPALFDAMTAILVTRTDRVDRLIRPHVYDAPFRMSTDKDGYDNSPWSTIKLWNFYFSGEHKTIEQPVAEWHERVKSFIAQYDPDADGVNVLTAFWDRKKGFKPTPWVPVRWVGWQMEQYDDAPMLGYLHRPVFVPFRDEHGKPLSDTARANAMATAWQQAMETLPAQNRPAHTPQRVFFDTGADFTRIVPLSRALAQEMPDLDPANSETGFNLSQRIGDTGISSPLAQIALALMRSYAKGGVSATVNLRHDEEASIIMVRPPSAAQKKANKRQPDPFMVKLMPQF